MDVARQQLMGITDRSGVLRQSLVTVTAKQERWGKLFDATSLQKISTRAATKFVSNEEDKENLNKFIQRKTKTKRKKENKKGFIKKKRTAQYQN